MSNESGSKGRKMTKRELQKHILTAISQKTPAQVALDFQRTYLANWMKKQGKTITSNFAPHPSDASDKG